MYADLDLSVVTCRRTDAITQRILVSGLLRDLRVSRFDRAAGELGKDLSPGCRGILGQNVGIVSPGDIHRCQLAVARYGGRIHANCVNRDLMSEQELQDVGITRIAI